MKFNFELHKNDWENSYKRKENFVFLASDEVVRFISRFIIKRVGINNYEKIYNFDQKLKVLDVCCGIGRNSLYGEQMGLDMYGFDLSLEAVRSAIKYLKINNINTDLNQRFKAASVTEIPWDEKFFDHAICDSALDSMAFSVAKAGISELARVIKKDGFFYCNLISGDIESDNNDSTREVIINNSFEKGTIQSYFNEKKIKNLLEPNFEIINYELHKIFDKENRVKDARWHIITKRK